MHHELAHQLRQRRLVRKIALGRPLRPRRPPRQRQPDSIRLSYFRAVMQLLNRARGMVHARVLPMLPGLVAEAKALRGDARTDAPNDVNRELDRISEEFYRNTSQASLEAMAESYGQRTSDFQKDELQRQLKASLGVEVPINDRTLGPRIRAFTAENVALIKSIPQRYFDQVERQVIAGVRDGSRWEEIATELEERFGVAESSAQLVARDQVGKFFGELNEVRQSELGVVAYLWRTSNDSRVREEHAAREGQSFTWADPPEDGHPGEAILCRCFAEPDLTPILEDL